MSRQVLTVIIAAIAIAVLPAAVFAKSDDAVVANNGKPILVQSSQPVVEIHLKANPSTGYRWFLAGDYNPLLIQPVSVKFVPAKKSRPGAPGVDVWKFRLKAAAFVVPRVLRLNLIQAKAWDMKTAKKRQFVIVTG